MQRNTSILSLWSYGECEEAASLSYPIGSHFLLSASRCTTGVDWPQVLHSCVSLCPYGGSIFVAALLCPTVCCCPMQEAVNVEGGSLLQRLVVTIVVMVVLLRLRVSGELLHQ